MQPHEDPQTPYEKRIEAMGLDCGMYGCWKPIQGFVLVANDDGCGRGTHNELGLCEPHLRERGGSIRWLES